MRAVRPTKQTLGGDARLAQQKKTVEGFERLHVQITQQQYQRLKRIAFERDARLAEVVREALGDWLSKQP
jgi:hypothetical protein